jgi:hypothetical protein
MTDIDFRRIDLPPYAIKFFATFLRFEFALKEAGYLFESGRAQVDWSQVARDLGQSFFVRVDELGIAHTILTRPPKEQLTAAHQLSWGDVEPPRNVQQLFEAVRRIRNNLVHGGKSGDPEHDPDNPHRSENLIREAQTVVEHVLLQLSDVRAHFEGHY